MLVHFPCSKEIAFARYLLVKEITPGRGYTNIECKTFQCDFSVHVSPHCETLSRFCQGENQPRSRMQVIEHLAYQSCLGWRGDREHDSGESSGSKAQHLTPVVGLVAGDALHCGAASLASHTLRADLDLARGCDSGGHGDKLSCVKEWKVS